MLALGMSPQKRSRDSFKGARGSFAGGSFIGGDGAPVLESADQREKREKSDAKD